MTCSSATKPLSFGSLTNRGRIGGTLTLANSNRSLTLVRTTTARFSERLEM